MHGMSCHWSSALTVRSPEKPVAFSPLTHGPTKRPCTIHLLSVAVSVMVIFSTSTSQARQNETSCSAPCQPQPVAHGFKQSKSFAAAQDAVPPVPLTGENQNRSHSACPLICVPSDETKKGNTHAKTPGISETTEVLD